MCSNSITGLVSECRPSLGRSPILQAGPGGWRRDPAPRPGSGLARAGSCSGSAAQPGPAGTLSLRVPVSGTGAEPRRAEPWAPRALHCPLGRTERARFHTRLALLCATATRPPVCPGSPPGNVFLLERQPLSAAGRQSLKPSCTSLGRQKTWYSFLRLFPQNERLKKPPVRSQLVNEPTPNPSRGGGAGEAFSWVRLKHGWRHRVAAPRTQPLRSQLFAV